MQSFPLKGTFWICCQTKKNLKTNLVKNAQPLQIPIHRNPPSTPLYPYSGPLALEHCALWSTSSSSMEEFIRNGDSGTPPQTCRIRISGIYTFTSSPGDSEAENSSPEGSFGPCPGTLLSSPLPSSGKETRDLRTCTHLSPTAQPHAIKPGIPCTDSPRPTVGACTAFFSSLQQGRTMPPLSTPRPHAGWRLGCDTLWGDTAPGAEIKEHQKLSKINNSVMQYIKKGKFIQSPS